MSHNAKHVLECRVKTKKTPSNYRTSTGIALLFCLLFGTVACHQKQDEGHIYNRVCEIYAEVTSQPADVDMKRYLIAEQIQTEFPDFFEANYVHIMDMDASERYETFKLLEEEVVGSGSWSCPAIDSFYAEMSKVEQ